MSRAKQVSGIYVIRNTQNGKVYVGKSVDVFDRWCHHQRRLRRGLHTNRHLQAAWDLHGSDSFVFEVLEEAARALLPALEESWMSRLQSSDRERGYNLDLTTPSGKIMSTETRARIGAANRGKIRTLEMRAQMSLVKQGHGKGRVKSPEEIEHLRTAHTRRSAEPDGYAWARSSEGRAALSAAGKKGSARRWHKEAEDGS